MIYAVLIEGLEPDKRAEIDTALEGTTSKVKVRRERDAVSAVMGFMK